MKSINEMTYSEMVQEEIRVKTILKNCESYKLYNDLTKYLKKLQKELAEYKRLRSNYGK